MMRLHVSAASVCAKGFQPAPPENIVYFTCVLLAALSAVVDNTPALPVLHPGEDPAGRHFQIGIELQSQAPTSTAVEKALREMGFGFVNYYVTVAPEQDLPEAETNQAMMALCERLGVNFALACHHRNPAEATCREAVAKGAAFQGIVFDELEHIRLMNPQFSPPSADPLLADPASFDNLQSAYDKTLGGYRNLKAHFDSLGVPRLVATHVWPELLHLAARAGFIPCPKICKEFYSPVSLAVGMGAARQYGRDLWADCDLWYFQLVPGHTPEELWCNLLLAYWLGTDCVYLEGSGYNLLPAGKQGTPFSLVNQIDAARYQLTPHGEALKRFCREYLPMNPRPWTFRDVKPDIVILRFEDGDYGQASWGDNRLYGSANLHSDADTAAWRKLWNMLTFGRTGDDGLAYFKASVPHPVFEPRHHVEVTPSYATDPAAAGEHSFFVPLNGVVVYDHLAGYDLLKDVPLILVTGKQISDETRDAVRKRAQEGAVCVIWRALAKPFGCLDYAGGTVEQPAGSGRMVFTDDFAAPDTVKCCAPFLGSKDEIRYRFGDRRVILHRVTDNDIRVEIQPA
jgi:hypothetical protein